MAYTQNNNPFTKLMSNIGSGLSKLNIKSPSMSSSTRGASGQRAYQQAQLKRPSHLRESKFEYDVRMRKERSRVKSMHDPDKDKIPTGVDATPWGDIPGEQQTVSTNPNDKRVLAGQHVVFGGKPGDEYKYRSYVDVDEFGKYIDRKRGEWKFEFQRSPSDPKYRGPNVFEPVTDPKAYKEIEKLFYSANKPWYEGKISNVYK